jgi:hypothetical protein
MLFVSPSVRRGYLCGFRQRRLAQSCQLRAGRLTFLRRRDLADGSVVYLIGGAGSPAETLAGQTSVS